MKIGIVGSRRRNSLNDRQMILDLVRDLKTKFGEKLELVSGGCRTGADNYAEDASRIHVVKMKIFLPVGNVKSKWEFRVAAFARNRQIAEYSDVLFAQVSSDRTGGTENTIAHAVELGKRERCFLLDIDGSIKTLEEWPSIPNKRD